MAELTGAERVQADAAARGLEVEIIERPAARSLEEAAELMGITPADIVKSLVVKRSDDTYVFALVPGGRKISWPKLRGLLGVNKLQLPDAVARARRDRLRARHHHAARLDDRVARGRRRERRGSPRLDGRRRARPQPLRRRRRAHRRVRRDGRRHQRPRVAGPIRSLTLAARPPDGDVADVALAHHAPRRRRRSSRTGSAPGHPSLRSVRRARSSRPSRPATWVSDLREDLGRLRARDAVLAVDDEERHAVDAVGLRLRDVGLHGGGEAARLERLARGVGVEADLGAELDELVDAARRGGPR